MNRCPICKKENRIVNECRCDPNNLPTVPFSKGQTVMLEGVLTDDPGEYAWVRLATSIVVGVPTSLLRIGGGQ